MKARSTAAKVSNATAAATVAAMKRADAAEAVMRGAEGLEASVNAAAAVGAAADTAVVDGTGVAAATTAAMEAMTFETDSDADIIVYSTIADMTAPEGEPASSSATVDTVLHEQISILRLFLLRAKTFEFAWWGMRNAVDIEDMTDGAKSLLSRLVAVRRERLLPCEEPVL
ncbi:hypothetical protein BU14_0166s0039 [Porphyra umbilicalis]|uniref:Uncharacterized protein n=1 Tax=Porphyra umbilicalis TaxID=2786 RepID=A0A1X6P7Y5_PORUM|nr:hypothetical protein BU14_0166s0039 [Porphyra umbilicalis]|eukprot:OSX76999.1 hypothetical protein BU14_0166s0039 [Porphyra umbilicalis]